jgi:rare lipoprotein A
MPTVLTKYIDDILLGMFLVLLMALLVFPFTAHAESGKASYYSGGRAACPGRRVGPMTAAHKTLPCGSVIRVTTHHGSAVLTVTDRGPFVRGRIVDVSSDAARSLGLVGPGVLQATVERLR